MANIARENRQVTAETRRRDSKVVASISNRLIRFLN